jgi:hypothetical protein
LAQGRARNPRFRIITTAVKLPSLSEFYLDFMARTFRAALSSNPEVAKRYKKPHGGGSPCFPFAGPQWRVFAGGALVSTSTFESIHNIAIDNLPMGIKPRVVVPFQDGTVARQVLVLDTSPDWKRRTAWLYQAQDGTWVFRMRWELAKLKIETHAQVHGTNLWKPREQRYRPKRWMIAPPDWPRNKWGRCLGTRQATALIGREAVQRLLKWKS